jgi:hypothetical protein
MDLRRGRTQPQDSASTARKGTVNVTDEKIGSETQNEQQNTDEPLGEGGKKALEAERRARRDVERDLRKARERITEFERGDLLREVAAEKGLTAAQARRLSGSTREELLTDADDLLESFGTKESKPISSRPKETLRPGASSAEEPAEDAAAVAEKILS